MKVSEILCEETNDPLGQFISTIKPGAAAQTNVDQDKLDQIIQRISAPKADAPVVTPVAAPAVTSTPVAPTKTAKAKPQVGQGAKKSAYVPVTSSPFEISLRKAAIGAKIVGNELAAFLGQCAHESAAFTTTKEASTGAQYEGNKLLGNTQPGDGVKYKGRGFIQITGRYNYTEASKALGIDLVNHPELAERPDVAIKVSLWYWNTRVKPKVANFANTKQVTKKVNGGLNGLKQREKFTQSFKVANR